MIGVARASAYKIWSPDGAIALFREVCVLHRSCPGTKEAASACNHSLMKLVTPEDDEDEEETGSGDSQPREDSPPKTEGDTNGKLPLDASF